MEGECDGKLLTSTIDNRPLVWGGLEILIQVTVDMGIGESNLQALKKYEELVSEHYKEPVNRMFDDVTASALEALKSDDDDDNDQSDIEESGEERDRNYS